MLDQKSEKNGVYEIIMPKDDKYSYFACDNLKGNITSAKEEIVAFTFKPPKPDTFI